eukprot:6214190-Pleurochrysis_carterae.AAC.2
MSPAAFATSKCADECTASLFARKQSSQAMLPAMSAHAVGASRVHCGSSRSTSARRWLKRACSISAVICVPLVCSRLPCVTTAGDARVLALGLGTTSTHSRLRSGTASPVESVSDEWPVVA